MLATGNSAERIAAAVHAAIAAVMVQRDLDPGRIASEARLSDTLGLKSMDLARIVLTLEDDLATDPFQTIAITSVRTVGDLVAAYLAALGLSGDAAPGAQDMAAEMAQARARRAGRRR